ncbi:MAG: HRDC domain-containing protein, partial [Acidimicrobiales bacterium]
LHRWRAGVARASGVPAHVILHDRSLEALASLRPATPEELLAVPGLGPVKAARYGPTLLSLLALPTAGIA